MYIYIYMYCYNLFKSCLRKMCFFQETIFVVPTDSKLPLFQSSRPEPDALVLAIPEPAAEAWSRAQQL